MSKNLSSIYFSTVLLAAVILAQEIVLTSKDNQTHKHDFSEINHIKYGLFSINQWKVKLSEVINSEITTLNINENKKNLKPVIESQLNQLIDGVNKKMQNTNEKSFGGRVKQAFIDAVVDIDDIKEGVPQYADEIMRLMDKPTTKDKIQDMIQNKVDDYFDRTFEEQDLSEVDMIMQRTGQDTIDEAKAFLKQKIVSNQVYISLLSWILISLVISVFMIAGFSKRALPSAHYLILVGLLFILLFTGVATPMIDLEAKISEMSFILFDHPVKFLDQVLYFQSKSVLDVFWLMIIHPELQMKIVGLLMVVFSVVFPAIKLLSTVVYYYDFRKLRQSKWIQFFVLKSGKWSMTDVLIIAIFMAYIGFNGVISSQLGNLHTADSEIVLLTTNGTSLQPGFYLFAAYSLLALFLSEFLSQKSEKTLQK